MSIKELVQYLADVEDSAYDDFYSQFEALSASLEKHDEDHHDGHYDPNTMSCKFRDNNPVVQEVEKKIEEKKNEDDKTDDLTQRRIKDYQRAYEDEKNGSGFTEPVFPDDLNSLNFVKGLGGTTEAALYEDKNGKLWVLKTGGSPGHAKIEHEASEAYRALGIYAPASRMYGENRLAEYVDGVGIDDWMLGKSKEEKNRVMNELRRGFAADAILGNHDVLGFDNVIVTPDGKVCRIDCGGSLGKRGSGGDCPYGEFPDELFTMRNQGTAISGKTDRNRPDMAKTFGSIPIGDVLDAAVALNWDDAIAKVSGEKGAMLRKRVEHAKQLAFYSDNFVKDGGYSVQANEKFIRAINAILKTKLPVLARSVGDEYERGFKVPPQSGKDYTGLLDDLGNGNDIDLSRSDLLYAGQGEASNYGLNAAKLKVLELDEMGISLDEIISGDINKYGVVTAKDYPELFRSAATFYKENKSEFDADKDAHLFRKAGTVVFLKNSGLGNITKDGKKIVVGRTETTRILKQGTKPGDYITYDKDPHGSYTYAFVKKYTPGEKCVVSTEVPLTRCPMIDLLSNVNGENAYLSLDEYSDFMFDFGMEGTGYDPEFEISANTCGIPTKFIGLASDLGISHKNDMGAIPKRIMDLVKA